MSAWVKKRKIWVKSERSCSVSFCAQSRQSSPSGTSSGIQWICCWRFQYSNAHGYSNGLYCLRASRRGMSVGSLEMRIDADADDQRTEQEEDQREPAKRARRIAFACAVGAGADDERVPEHELDEAERGNSEIEALEPGRRAAASLGDRAEKHGRAGDHRSDDDHPFDPARL